MEGITAYLLPGALIVLGIAAASHYLGHNNIFVWIVLVLFVLFECIGPFLVVFLAIIQNKPY